MAHMGGPTTPLTVVQLKTQLNDAVLKAFNPHPNLYQHVHAQFVRFEETDLDVKGTEKRLMRALQEYGYTTASYVIGKADKSDRATTLDVQNMAGSLSDKYGDEKALIILIFSGHGTVEEKYLDGQRASLKLWVAGSVNPEDGTLKSPKVDWTVATGVLEVGVADALHILDCSCAGSAVTPLGSEMLVSTSFDGTTSEKPSKSFTAAVAAEFERRKGTRFTAAELGATLCRNMNRYGLISQPIHIAHSFKNSVSFSRLEAPSSRREFQPGDGTRVLVTVHLAKDQLLPKDLAELKQWLFSNVPTDVDGMNIEVEGYFRGSCVLLLTIPLEIWGFIQYVDAFRFTAHVKSRNLLLSAMPTQSLSIRGAENVKPGLLKK